MLARAIHAANGGTARYKKPLSATQWSLAFDGFAVSAAVCDMMPFTTAMAHKAGSCFTLRPFSVCSLHALSVYVRESGTDGQGQRKATVGIHHL